MPRRRMHKPLSGVGIAVGDRLAGPGPAGGAPGPPTAAGHAQQHHPHPRLLHGPRASDLTPLRRLPMSGGEGGSGGSGGSGGPGDAGGRAAAAGALRDARSQACAHTTGHTAA